MSVDYEDEILKSDSDNIDTDYIEYARITFGNENNYFMKTEKITIGRNSADGTVDVDVGPHTFVSRKHLEMMYSYRKLKIKCLGKNGIFIDNYFKAHSTIPYELPYECTLRFPSTNIEVNVHQLLGRQRGEYSQPCGNGPSINGGISNTAAAGVGSESHRSLHRKRKAGKGNCSKSQYSIFDAGGTEPLLHNRTDRQPPAAAVRRALQKKGDAISIESMKYVRNGALWHRVLR